MILTFIHAPAKIGGMDDMFYKRSLLLDARGIPTRECPSCASTLFTIQAVFDDNYEIGMYLLDAECTMCHTKVTAPTPLDLFDE